MKLFIKNNRLTLFILLLCCMATTGCKEGDGEADYGFAYIYMPQATTSGGLNNHYLVPSGAGKDTYNFKEENGKLNIYLGVLRSGKISDASGFTVDVAASSTQTDEVVASGAISNAVALQAGSYTLPDKAIVQSGKESGSFYLSLDMDVVTNYRHIGKNLVLAVGIANPTHYQLSKQNTSVVVVIDVDALLDILSSPSI